jgi:hypothetical protein
MLSYGEDIIIQKDPEKLPKWKRKRKKEKKQEVQMKTMTDYLR